MSNPGIARIYLSPPHLDGRERDLLLEAYDSNWISTVGPQVDEFEREMCKRIGVRYATALSSGTAALHIALVNLGITTGDSVVCSTQTFAASANPIAYQGGTPVFIDSDRESWTMNPDLLDEELERCARRRSLPKAVIAVDLYGQCANFTRIEESCRRYDIPLIEDAAEALGATFGDRSAGSFGEMGILSFNGNKIITTSGGGMLVSNNRAHTDNARYLATQARDPFPYYQHSKIGYNYRLSNLLAAVGRGQLQNLDRKVERKRAMNRFYREALADVPGIDFMPEAPYGRATFWLTCIIIDPAAFGATNDELRLHLESQNVESRPIWKPMHLQPAFAGCRVAGGEISKTLFENGLCLPSGTGLTNPDLERITDLIRSFSKQKAKR